MIPLIPAGEADALGPYTEQLRKTMGFVPNDVYAMAHNPRILDAVCQLARVVNGPGEVSPVLKRMIGFVVSTVHGSAYCTAHTATMAARCGLPEDGVAALARGDDSVFSAEEQAALRFARAAASHATTEADFAALNPFFSSAAVVELLAVVCFYAWLNTWNDAAATPLEDEPGAFAAAHLATAGWTPGRHLTR